MECSWSVKAFWKKKLCTKKPRTCTYSTTYISTHYSTLAEHNSHHSCQEELKKNESKIHPDMEISPLCVPLFPAQKKFERFAFCLLLLLPLSLLFMNFAEIDIWHLASHALSSTISFQWEQRAMRARWISRWTLYNNRLLICLFEVLRWSRSALNLSRAHTHIYKIRIEWERGRDTTKQFRWKLLSVTRALIYNYIIAKCTFKCHYFPFPLTIFFSFFLLSFTVRRTYFVLFVVIYYMCFTKNVSATATQHESSPDRNINNRFCLAAYE